MKSNLDLISSPSTWVMQKAQSWPKGSKILDFAAGKGRHSFALSELHCKKFDILAVDQNSEELKNLKKVCSDITICHADLEKNTVWPFFDQKFDVVLVTNYLFRPRLTDLFSLIRTGGCIVYETFAEGNEIYGKPRNPDYLLSKGELLKILPKDFEVVDYFHGKVEQPKPAIIQRLAARKR